MRTTKIAVILLLGILLMSGFACGGGPEVTPTPTPLPTVTMLCEQARNAIQEALSNYYDERGEWPTTDGQPGDIEWTKLVPNFMAGIPANDATCDWSVNSDPAGTVCVGSAGTGCIPCSCQCGTRCAEFVVIAPFPWGLVGGIVGGVLGLLAVAAVIVYFALFRRRKSAA